MVPRFVLLLVLVGGGVLLVAAVGLALLIVGIAKRATAFWVIGLVCLVPAVLAAVVAVPMLVYLGVSAPAGVRIRRERHMVPAFPSEEEEGDYVRMGDGLATVRAGGVEIEVLEPGGGGSSSSVSSHHGIRGARVRHELRLGEVEIVITNVDGRRTLEVDGDAYGPVQPGDTVLITPSRDVLVNGMRRKAVAGSV